MKLIVFGAANRTRKEVVKHILMEDHEVIAFALIQPNIKGLISPTIRYS
ncbi:MAG: hypothetical protein ACQEWF_19405 [Bacillota bacterium]